jgi:plasmid replication initiation protein
MHDPVQTDMFQVSAFDPPLRDNRDVMEYPFLAIQKGRRKPILFISPDNRIKLEIIAPEKRGLATIWDWDLMIYISAHLNDAIEQGYQPSQWVEFAPHDALQYMRKGVSGRHYKELVQAIRRLSSTTITTSIRMNDTEGTEGVLRWIEDYRIPKRYLENQWLLDSDLDVEGDPRKPWAIKVPVWIYNAIIRRDGVLAVHSDYFKLSGGLERWLYRLARKAVPDKASPAGIKFRMETLHKRSGSTRALRFFARDVRDIAERNALPEYGVQIFREGRYELVYLFRDQDKPRRMPRGVRLIEQRKTNR